MNQITLCFILLLAIFPVFAHVPHDEIYEVATPADGGDPRVYAIVRSNIMKSKDKGVTWARVMAGLDNISLFRHIAVDPIRPNRLYLSTVIDGVYTSDNAGQSWYKINQGLDALKINLLFVPADKKRQTAFVTGVGRGLYRFDNDQWHKIYDKKASITAFSGLRSRRAQTAILLMGDQYGLLSKSLDNGDTWQTMHEFSNCGDITALATTNNPSLNHVFFVGTRACGVFRTQDGGANFIPTTTGISDLNIRSVAMSPKYARDSTVFATTWSQAAFVSNDGGIHWQASAPPLQTDHQADKQHKPHFRNIAFSGDFKNDHTVFISGFAGLFKSINRGKTWQQMTTLSSELIQGVAISPNYAADATVAITTYKNGFYYSSNRGRTWQSIADTQAERNFDVAFSPGFAFDKTLFVSSSLGKNSIGKSTDGGLTWQTQPLLVSDDPTIITLSPDFAQDATLFLGSRNGRIYRSHDGGDTFQIVFSEYFQGCSGCLSSLLTSPNYAQDNTVFAANKTGIHISQDGGNTWQRIDDPYQIFGNKLKGNHVKLAVPPDYQYTQQMFIATFKGLFLRDNSSNRWQPLANDAALNGYITALALSPNFAIDHTLLVTVKGKGTLKSTDGGKSFQLIHSPLGKMKCNFELWDEFPDVSSAVIKFSPAYSTDHTIFAVCSEELARSQDDGKTWRKWLINP